MNNCGVICAVLALIVLHPSAAQSADCTHTIPTEEAREFQNALNARANKDKEGALKLLKEIQVKLGDNFCVLHEIGRTYVHLNEYEQASESLLNAVEIATDADLSKNAVYNVLGYNDLKEKNYESAVSYFKTQTKNPNFLSLPPETRMKVFNNLGYTLLQLDQYEAAKSNLLQAVALGSSLARKNLEVVDSILAVQHKNDPELPGIFAVAIASSRNKDALKATVENAASRLNTSTEKFRIFDRGNEMFTVTYGVAMSYPKSDEMREEALSAGFSDANIVSTSRWQNVTSKLLN